MKLLSTLRLLQNARQVFAEHSNHALPPPYTASFPLIRLRSHAIHYYNALGMGQHLCLTAQMLSPDVRRQQGGVFCWSRSSPTSSLPAHTIYRAKQPHTPLFDDGRRRRRHSTCPMALATRRRATYIHVDVSSVQGSFPHLIVIPPQARNCRLYQGLSTPVWKVLACTYCLLDSLLA